jgi:hypothetical protein
LTLEPGESTQVTYPFFYFQVVLHGSTVEYQVGAGTGSGVPAISWKLESKLGDVHWKEPAAGLKLKNVGQTAYVAYIAEWR